MLFNSVLVAGFFLQHSLMARGTFKDWMNATFGKRYHIYEKGAYQTASAVCLLMLVVLYQGTQGLQMEMPGEPIIRAISYGLVLIGSVFMLQSLIDMRDCSIIRFNFP